MQPFGDVDDETEIKCSDNEESENENIISEEAAESQKRSIPLDKEEIVNRFVFFDFETTQTDCIADSKLGPVFEHRPNLCVVRVICDDCRNRDFEGVCGRCGIPEHVFEGENCVNDFCRFLFNKHMRNTIAIAHNAKGFDSHFIMQYLSENGIPLEVIARGNVCNSVYFSTLNFIF